MASALDKLKQGLASAARQTLNPLPIVKYADTRYPEMFSAPYERETENLALHLLNKSAFR